MRIRQNNILKLLTCGLLLGGLTSCSDVYDDIESGKFDSKSHLVLTFVTPNDDTSTRSAVEDPDGYEAGIDYENTVNIDEGDYKIYFFTYDSSTKDAGTLIAEFEPESITQSSTSSTTTYTVTGDVPETLMNVSNFRVVMLANWGWWYQNVEEGVTTIDDLCEGGNSTFYADKKFIIDQNNLIPFYGVQEYSGVTFTYGTTTTLSTPVSLLRALAKVEVILTSDSDVEEFDNVSIVNYNAQGYCAPWQVYTAADYDTDASKNPDTDFWPDEWVTDLHLVGEANDTGTKTQVFTKVSGTTQDTWRIYLPEYNNMSEDYSYITLTIDGEPYEIYFADYEDGVTDNTETSNRYNLKRNNLYRYYVTLKNRELRVFVETWENVFDNEWSFGITEPQVVGSTFASNNIEYEVLTSTVDNPNAELTVCTIAGGIYASSVEIPSSVRHNGFTYTVTEIGKSTFDGQEGIASITLPETITYIGDYAFQDCVGLTSLYIYNYSPPTCGDYTFSMDNLSNVTLYVPYQVIQTYLDDETWGNFGFMSIEAIPGTEIESNP